MATDDISVDGFLQSLHRCRSTRTFCTTNSGHPSCSEHSSPRARPRYEDAADHVLRPDNSSELDFGGEDGSSRERWSVCLGSMKQQDELMVKRWNDDIDTLLVFAGLFSAILTAFIIEFYRQLQYNPNDTTVLLLQQISQQLSASGTGTTSQNLTLQTFSSPNTPFHPPGYAVRMNVTWFAALVCSLVAALIGILAKQWLREYGSEICSSPRESVRIRQFRYDGLTSWHVAEIIGFLPILVEISLILFLHGLLELLWSLNVTVASVSTVIIAISLIFYLGTMVVPAFSPSSPFKAPQGWAFCVALWKAGRFTRYFRASSPSNIPFDLVKDDPPPPSTWADREVESGRLVAGDLDRRALARTYKRSLDEDFLDAVGPCIKDLESDAAVSLIFEVVARRGECSVRTLLDSIRNPNATFGLERFILKAGSRGSRRLMWMILDVLPRMIRDGVQSKVTLLDMLFTLRKLLTEAERAVCESALHRRALDTLALLLDERGTYHVQRASLDLLWEMTRLGCNMAYCPNGIQNVIFCARDAHARNDHDTFARACGVLLGRLPATQGQQHQNRQWLQHWIRDLEQYFRARKSRNLRYDAGLGTKWCSGLAAIAGKEKELVRVELVTLLEEGAKLGLVDCELEEGDALHELKHVCLSTCLTGTAETGKASASDTYTDSDIGDFTTSRNAPSTARIP